MAHHLLTTYLKSYIAVIKTQFSTKAFQGGREARTCWLSSISPRCKCHVRLRCDKRLLRPRRAWGFRVGSGIAVSDHGFGAGIIVAWTGIASSSVSYH